MNQMNTSLRNEKGLTLIEILATIVILFVISMFIFNIINSSGKQNQELSTESQQINNAAYLLKQITKDIRKTNDVFRTTVGDKTTYEFKSSNPSSGTFNHEAIYMFDESEGAVYRNQGVIVNNVESFDIDLGKMPISVTINFEMNKKQFDTTIALRKGQQ